MHQSIETLPPLPDPLGHSRDLMQPMPGFNTFNKVLALGAVELTKFLLEPAYEQGFNST